MLELSSFTKNGPSKALGLGESGEVWLGWTFGLAPSADLDWPWTPETKKGDKWFYQPSKMY